MLFIPKDSFPEQMDQENRGGWVTQIHLQNANKMEASKRLLKAMSERWLFGGDRERLLSVETPVETALLASLTGIKCFYGNQWHCRLTDNATKLTTVLQGSPFNSLYCTVKPFVFVCSCPL